jgi:hypothetical protein
MHPSVGAVSISKHVHFRLVLCWRQRQSVACMVGLACAVLVVVVVGEPVTGCVVFPLRPG